MRKHLYVRSVACQGYLDPNIVLDDTIKQHILDNRFYHRPKEEKPVPITTQINNYNQIINIIQRMPPEQKINHYIANQNNELLEYEDRLENSYRIIAKKLDTDKVKGFQLLKEDLYDVVDENLTDMGKNVKTFNLMYDQVADKINIYYGGVWNAMAPDKAMRFMLSAIQSFYLNSYECYVIRNIETNTQNNLHTKAEFRDRLVDYYTFLVCFGLVPFTSGRQDLDNLIEEDMAEKYYNLFLKTKEGVTDRTRQQAKDNMYNLIKKKTKTNIQDLNESIMKIIKADAEFHMTILSDNIIDLPVTK